MAFFLVLAMFALSLNAQTDRSLITKAIDEAHLHVLAGNTRPEAKAQNDLGVSPTICPWSMILQLTRSAADEQDLQQ